MSAPLAGKFQDHYAVLEVEPDSDLDTIHRAYTALAEKYHPRNWDTGNPEKFQAVTLAYEVLSDPEARKAFDMVRCGPEKESRPRFSGESFFSSLEREIPRRQAILCVLYDRRRQKPLTPSLSIRQLSDLLYLSEDEIAFAVWYLKQCGFIRSDDKSALQITVAGMDFLEAHLPSPEAMKALIKFEDGIGA
jgi:curved DNA-binding protein